MSEERASYQSWRLAPALRPYVESMVAYDLVQPPGVHRGLPSTALAFVLPVEVPLEVGWAGREATMRRTWSCVSGLHTAPAEIRDHGRQAGIQLALTAAGVRALLGAPLGALAAEIAELDAVTPLLAELPEQLHDPLTWPERLRLVEERLLALLAAGETPQLRAEVGRALGRLTRGIGVAEVADEVGFSRRHLGSLFRAEIGVTPKEYHRLARFERSRDRLLLRHRAGTGSLAEVAAEVGYADQAHLSREWSALAGCTPTTWLRTEFPFVQDDSAAADAG
ncbi:helix-turn-helix domain-containing protein [Nocardioides speluncae]|uniref:helix-turn-helix domain-containing protein n=1 Tax=Nocardioides speluncae TaxID=2670337 RepID=UPI001F0C253D|nr:AraC family transcriptional regulator [Nocardioides speluncae]